MAGLIAAVPQGLVNGACISEKGGVTQDSDLDRVQFNNFFNQLLLKVLEYGLINLLEDIIPGEWLPGTLKVKVVFKISKSIKCYT